MARSGVEVLGVWPSPYSNRVQIALNLKSIDYEYIEVNIHGYKSECLLKSNPVHKKVPVLIHGDKSICESLVILQYIDEAWVNTGPSLLPSEPYDRAVAHFWATYIDYTWYQHLRATLIVEGEDAKKAKDEIVKGLVMLEEAFTKCSKGKKFFGGDEIGYLDIALGCFLSWIAVINKRCNITLMDESNTPNLSKWAQHFCAAAAVKDVLPHVDELYEYSQHLVSVFKGSATKQD